MPPSSPAWSTWTTFGMLERRRQPRFPLEALAERGIVRQRRRDQLQRVLAVERQVSGPVNDPHPATADLALDPVAGEDRARADRRLGFRAGRVVEGVAGLH